MTVSASSRERPGDNPSNGRGKLARRSLPVSGQPDAFALGAEMGNAPVARVTQKATVSLDAARSVVRAELDLYHAQYGYPRPVTICDLNSGYDAARRAPLGGTLP